MLDENQVKLRDIIVKDGRELESFNTSNNHMDINSDVGDQLDDSGTAVNLKEMTYKFNLRKNTR